jgi:TolA-binding protein
MNESEVLEQINQLRRSITSSQDAQREELKMVDAHLEKLSRWVLLGTVVAYVLFAVLCATAAYFWVDLASGQQKSELRAVKRKLEVTERELDRLRKQEEKRLAEARARSERIAKHFQMYLGGNYEKVFIAHQKLSNRATTPLERLVVRHVHKEAQRHASFEAYTKGVAAYNEGKTKKALQHLQRAFKYDRTGPHLPGLRYYLGLAYYKLSQYRKATKHLEALVRSKHGKEILDAHGMFRLGHAHEMLKQDSMAKRYYNRLLKQFPKSQYTSIVKAKLRQLQ